MAELLVQHQMFTNQKLRVYTLIALPVDETNSQNCAAKASGLHHVSISFLRVCEH
jgi:hypothetical protein